MAQEFSFFIDHITEYYDKHPGKFVAIKNRDVLGVFDSQEEAVTTISKKEKFGTFLVQQCVQSINEVTSTFVGNVY